MEVRLLHLQYELALRTYVLLDGSWNARGPGRLYNGIVMRL
jgi:hypothetical protein